MLSLSINTSMPLKRVSKFQEDILRALNRRVVIFEYVTDDGRIVRRKGTRSKVHMPIASWRSVKRSKHKDTDKSIVYWDFYRNDWRSFHYNNFIRELKGTLVLF